MTASTRPDVAEHLPLSATDFHLLLVLEQEGPLWGYALLDALVEVSNGLVRPDIGSLYRTLARLMAASLLEDAGEGDSLRGKKRKYYRITDLGTRVLIAEGQRLERTVELLHRSRILPAV